MTSAIACTEIIRNKKLWEKIEKTTKESLPKDLTIIFTFDDKEITRITIPKEEFSDI